MARYGVTLRRFARACALACASGLTLAPAVALTLALAGMPAALRAEPLRVSPEAALQAATNALQAGRPQDALILAEGVLLARPDDTTALFVKARALRELGHPEGAVQAAQAAWSVAETPNERYFSAMMMAQMRSFAGQNGVAQLWLRRAAELAPDERLKAVAVQDFRQVRRITPWRLSLDLSVTPSDNLNDASTEAQEVPGGLVTTTPPLEGLRFGGSVSYRYMQPVSDRTRLSYGAFGGGSAVRLGSEARKVPGADAGDLGTAVLGGSLALETISVGQDRKGEAALSFRRHWQAGDPLADVTRLDLSLGQALSPAMQGQVRLGFTDTTRMDSPVGNSQRSEAGLSLMRSFEQGLVRLDLDLGRTLSEAWSVGRKDASVALSFTLAQPVLGMVPTLSLDYGAFDYEKPWIALPTGPDRKDRTRRIGVDVVLPELGAYGFAPEIGLSFTDRSSNYNLYESRSTDLRLGLKSVF